MINVQYATNKLHVELQYKKMSDNVWRSVARLL